MNTVAFRELDGSSRKRGPVGVRTPRPTPPHDRRHRRPRPPRATPTRVLPWSIVTGWPCPAADGHGRDDGTMLARHWVSAADGPKVRGRAAGVWPMRDRRFIAVHRGGPLGRADHVLLARWAADCAERVLHLFVRCSDDLRPLQAIQTIRAWANGEVKTGAAMKASLAAHAAARLADDKATVAAARAAGQAAATAHAADHCMGALLYALKALEAADAPARPELEAQLAKLPARLAAPVSSGVLARCSGRWALRR